MFDMILFLIYALHSSNNFNTVTCTFTEFVLAADIYRADTPADTPGNGNEMAAAAAGVAGCTQKKESRFVCITQLMAKYL